MAYIKKTWLGRNVQYPGRIVLTPTGQPNEYDVSRSEGAITEAGDLVSDTNLNDLEQRILSAIQSIADNDGNALNALSLGGHAAGEYPIVTSGTWTPTLYGTDVPGTPTYTLQEGTYYKIGFLVLLHFRLQISSKGGLSGIVSVGGLPFSVSSGSVQCFETYNYALSGSLLIGGKVNGTTINFQVSSPTSFGNLADTQITDTFYIADGNGWGVVP